MSSEARDGAHSGEAQYAASNVTPSAASAVTFGAWTTSWP